MARQLFRALLLLLCVTTIITFVSSCNICGDGNMILDEHAVLEFDYPGQGILKNNCKRWQVVVENPNAISTEFCMSTLRNLSTIPCKCASMETGKLIYMENITIPTYPSANAGTGTLGGTNKNNTNSTKNNSDTNDTSSSNIVATTHTIVSTTMIAVLTGAILLVM